MAESSIQTRKPQWKWVGITFTLYVLFYLLPLLIVGKVFTGNIVTPTRGLFVGAWSFGGIIIIAAVAGYLSKGVTIWEPVLAGVALVALWFIVYEIFLAPRSHLFQTTVVPFFTMMLVVFLLSLLGAWLGEQAQRLWKRGDPEST